MAVKPPKVTAHCPALACHFGRFLTSPCLCHAIRQDTRWGRLSQQATRNVSSQHWHITSHGKATFPVKDGGDGGIPFPTVTNSKTRVGGPSTLVNIVTPGVISLALLR
jgi:hypothetical protein